jgi:hypothetical protein
LLAHGRWFSLGTTASSTTKTGRHDIAEILLKVALNTKNRINQSIKQVMIMKIVEKLRVIMVIYMCSLNVQNNSSLKKFPVLFIFKIEFLTGFVGRLKFFCYHTRMKL